MKDTVQELFDKFGQSKPVFVGTMVEGELEFKLKDPYDPRSADIDLNDPIAKMMVDSYSEHFIPGEKRYAKQDRLIEIVQREIHTYIKRALVAASPLKNPQQSKLYKWFEFGRIVSLHDREGMILLYRYIEANINTKTFRFDGGSDNVHAKNVVAILEKMKEKYEQQE